MLNILEFIAVSVIIILGFLFLDSRRLPGTKLFWWYFGFLCILLFTGSEVVSNYFNPKIDIFNNSDYHILEHRGFRFNKELSLVDSERDRQALWDEKDGSVQLAIGQDSTIHVELTEYYEPFYTSSKEENAHILRNDLLGIDVSDYFRLETEEDTLELKIVREKHETFYLIRNGRDAAYETSVFQRDISVGYPLIDILLRTPRLDLKEDFKQALDGVYLLRSKIPIESNSTGKFAADEARGPLRLFPSGNLLRLRRLTVSNLNQSLSLSDVSIDSVFQTKVHPGEFIFSGIGLNQSKLAKLQLLNDSIASMEYVLPKMYQFRDESLVNHLFITSSTEVIERHQLAGGYFLNIFKSTDNLNHIDAEIKYKVNDARNSMKVGIKDFIDDPTKTIEIEANQPFQLSSSANNDLTWEFQVLDLKSTNDLTESRLNKFMLVFLSLVLLRIFFSAFKLNYDAYSGVSSLRVQLKYDSRSLPPSPLELSIYVVVFTMLVIRFILLWRTSTFVPIENIDISRFNALRASETVFDSTVLFAYGFLASTIVFGFFAKSWSVILEIFEAVRSRNNKLSRSINSLIKAARKLGNLLRSGWKFLLTKTGFRSDKSGLFRFLLVYIILLGFLFVVGLFKVSTLERIVNIFAPTIMFLGAIFLIYRLESKGQTIYGNTLFENDSFSKGVLVFLLGIVTLGYFAVNDAGFSIIFLLFGLIIFWLRFALYQKSNRFNLRTNRGKLLYAFWLIIVPSAVIFFFVFIQAQAIVFIINHLAEFLLGGTTLSLIAALAGIWHPRWSRKVLVDNIAVKRKVSVVAMLLAFTVLGLGFRNQDKLNKKFAYIKYRAEVQYNDSSLEKLILDKAYESSDIDYILRSVHNQWFINLYNDSPDEKYFELKPHFNQGSSYTTQTTDLAVLRFVISEHSKGTVFAILFLIGSLILVHLITQGSESTKQHQLILMALCLPVCIGFFVTLTATNRIIFFGQDFPLLSITSKLAVLMPLCIFLIVIFLKSEKSRVNNKPFRLDWKKGGLTYLTILFFFSICFLLMNPSNADDSDISSFDISGLIDRYEPEIKKINAEFLYYQATDPGVKPLTQTIKEFKEEYEEKTDSEYYKLLSDSVNRKFLWSLMEHFVSPLTNKWDQNELLHVRQRGDYYHITMNKKFYFLSSFREKENAWRGDVLATQHRLPFNFYNKNDKVLTKLDLPLKNYYTDILHKDSSFLELLPLRYRESFQNANVTYLSPKWTPNMEPLYLISAQSGNYEGNKPQIKILNDTSSLDFEADAPSVRLFDQDYLAVSTMLRRKERNIFSLRYSRKNQSYLAKNLWMNNGRRLYYPLGKESIWTYHLSNMVASAWKEEDVDSSLTVSLDYDLTKKVYNIVDQENKLKESLSYRSLSCVNDFKELGLDEMRNPENKSCLLLDKGRLVYKGDSRRLTNQLRRAIAKVNREIRGSRNQETLEGDIIDAIDLITEKRFDYSAVAIDGRGRIRLLFDYNKNDRPDPNNNRLYNRLLSQMYQKSTYADESDFFGNKAIMKLNPGPGSSFKPIVLSSVSSMYNMGWDSLRLSATPRTSPIYDNTNSRNQLIFYGGKSLRELGTYWSLPRYNVSNPWRLRGSRYLVSSNNLLHSMIIFMGAHDREELAEFAETKALKSLKNISNTRIVDTLHFPVINFYARRYAIDPDNWLNESSPDFFTKTSSILSNGLRNNFHIYPSLTSTKGDYEYDAFDLGDDRFKDYGNDQWVFPEVSTFYQADRRGNPAIRNGLFQPTLGAYPISVTPFKMAEASMRLLTLDKQEYLTSLNPDFDNGAGYEFFQYDTDSWGSEEAFVNDHRRHLLAQMHDVMKKDRGGTAWRTGVKLAEYEREGYYFYSKTGTINSAEFETKRDKHLIVMVTRTRLHDLNEPITQKELKNLKYYSIYLSYHGIERDEFAQGDNYADIIKAIMDSEMFRDYMENEDSEE